MCNLLPTLSGILRDIRVYLNDGENLLCFVISFPGQGGKRKKKKKSSLMEGGVGET